MKKVPISAMEKVCGLFYFARMLNKIRLFAKGELREDFHNNLGHGMDKRLCDFLLLSYDDVRKKTLDMGDSASDEEILQWCYGQGRSLTENDIFILNEFLRKFGLNDLASDKLAERKVEIGAEARDDIQTFFDFFEVDEGRKKAN